MTSYISSSICILCGQKSELLYENLVNHEGWIIGEMPDLSLEYCRNCSLAFLEPASSLAEQWRWYPSTYSARSHKFKLQSYLFEMTQRKSVRQLITGYGADIRVLDFGGGDGSWCKFAIQAGLDAKNYDPFATSSTDKAELDNQKYDVIRLEHVLEHALDPKSLLRQCVDLLSEDGVIVGNTPNFDSLGFKVFKKNWGFLHAPHHPILFSKRSINKLALAVGLNVETSPTRISSCWGHSLENAICRKLRLERVGHIWIYPFLLLVGQLIEFCTTTRGKYGSELQFVFRKENMR